MDYNSISYFCEFVNTISWIFWKQQEEFRDSGSRLSDGRPFCLFSSNEKIIQNILQKPLDNTEFVWYNTKLQYNRITMGNSALRQVSRSKRGDFWRRSLCNLTKARSLRSIRLRPRHLKCPWVVRLTHEAPDVQTPVFRGFIQVVPHRYTPHPTPAAAREFARRCHRITI